MKIKKLGALLVSAALCAGMAAPAFAFEGEAAPVEQPVLPEVVEEDVVTITDETSGALTPEGNLTLVDDYHTDYSDGSGQQFITLVSKSGKGVYLSGGEQQRIALARAILKDAPIVLMDEATAFADPENEHKIQIAFERLTKGKTVLMIAHRLPTIQNADEILVMEQGSIAERGTHDALMERNEIYASMWRDYQTSVAWNIGKETHHAS